MNERQALWAAAAELARGDATGALATVSRRRGSLPMAPDAKMLIAADGRRWGTVGGGCTEADVGREALAAAAAGAPRVVRHHLNADVAGEVGLSCGGTVEFFVEPIVHSAAAAALYDAVSAAIAHRLPGTVVTGLDWDGGPVKQARIGTERYQVGVPGWRDESAAPKPEQGFVDERLHAFVEPIPRRPRLVIFGAGHVGVEIARLAARAGFYVVLVDDRAEFANPQAAPEAEEIVVEDLRTALDRLAFEEGDAVLATTRGHSFDALVVERAAQSAAGYVGMLGSKRKRAVIFRALQEAGTPAAALERVRVPIGEPIGAETPVEIAVAVVAELIRSRRLGGPAGGG